MRIAVDAMGSDNFPVPDVEGAVQAARMFGDTILLVGDEKRVKEELARHDISGLSIEIVHAAEHVTMEDTPSQVGRSKPQSSLHIGSTLVKEGQADALVTAGNTGAVLAITTLYTLKRIQGVKRPTLTTLIPLREGLVTLTDVGANADCRPEWLVQFARMGSIYAENALGLKNPKVGLLSNGEEEGKGNDMLRETQKLLKVADLNFVGNVEPKEVLTGSVDVMVCDGFVGNIFVKTLEAFASELLGILRNELSADLRSKFGAALALPAFRRVRKRVDPFEIGGVPLLGLNGVVIIGHGRSNALAVKNMVRQARDAVAGNIVGNIRARLQNEKGEE